MQHIDTHYNESRREIRARISRLQVHELQDTSPDDWVTFFSTEHYLEPISLASRQPTVVEQPALNTVQVVLPIDNIDSASRTLQFTPGAWQHANEQWETVAGGIALNVRPQNQDGILRSIEAMKRNIETLNAAVEPKNRDLERFVREAIDSRMSQVEAKRQVVVDLAQALGADLVLSEREQRTRQATPKLRDKIASLRRPQARPGKVIVLTRDDFTTILDVIDAGASSLERTPLTAAKLEEEDIRNLLLSNLNGAMNLGAVGEAFSKRGKTDILLNVPEGGVFIAECKIWRGQTTISQSTRQILGYLTWKDAFGVVLIFSRNVRFSRALQNVQIAISTLESLKGTVDVNGDRHWTSRHSLPKDKSLTIELHHLVYNIST